MTQRIRDDYYKRGNHVHILRRGVMRRLSEEEIPPDVAQAAAAMGFVRPHTPVAQNPKAARARVPPALLASAAAPIQHAIAGGVLPPTDELTNEPQRPARSTPLTEIVRRLIREELYGVDPESGQLTEFGETVVRRIVREELDNPKFRAEILDTMISEEQMRWDRTPETAPEAPELSNAVAVENQVSASQPGEETPTRPDSSTGALGRAAEPEPPSGISSGPTT